MQPEEQTQEVVFPNRIVLPAETVNQELTCPICLHIIKDAYCVRECLHRFCLKCIEMALRVGKKQCPSCRAKCPSKRSCRKDKPFDDLIRAIYPDLGAAEKRQEQVMRANLEGIMAFQEAAKKGRQRQQELLMKYKKPRLRKADRVPRTEMNRRQATPRVPSQPCQPSPPKEEVKKRPIPAAAPDSAGSGPPVDTPPRKKRALEPRGRARLSAPPRNDHQEKSNPHPLARLAMHEKQFYVGFYTVGHKQWEGWMELEGSSTFFLEQTWRSPVGYLINTKTFRGTWSPLPAGGFRIECSPPSSSANPILANDMLFMPRFPEVFFDSQTTSICMKRVQENYVSHLRTRKILCLNYERQQASLQKKEIAFFLRRKNTCPHGELEKDNLITGLNASVKHLCRYLSQHVVIDPARCTSLPQKKLEAKNFQIFIGTRLKLGNGKFKDIERKMKEPLPPNFTLNQTIKLWNSEAELDLEWQVIGI